MKNNDKFHANMYNELILQKRRCKSIYLDAKKLRVHTYIATIREDIIDSELFRALYADF